MKTISILGLILLYGVYRGCGDAFFFSLPFSGGDLPDPDDETRGRQRILPQLSREQIIIEIEQVKECRWSQKKEKEAQALSSQDGKKKQEEALENICKEVMRMTEERKRERAEHKAEISRLEAIINTTRNESAVLKELFSVASKKADADKEELHLLVQQLGGFISRQTDTIQGMQQMIKFLMDRGSAFPPELMDLLQDMPSTGAASSGLDSSV